MARGFWHPDFPYWETDDDLPAEFRNAYPAGTQEVPLRPSPDHVWDGENWIFSLQPGQVPEWVTPLQLFDELDETHGIDLETEIGNLSAKALRRFRLSNEVRRADQLVGVLQSRLSWTDEQVDDLFRAAAARRA